MMRKIVLGAVAAALPLAATAQADGYTLDPIHSFVHFSVDHLGMTTMTGRFNKSSGKATLDVAGKKASIDLTIEAASIDTGDLDKGSRPRTRDEHLRAADFFNVAEHPRITYKSTNVKFSGDSPSEIEGNLTLLGITRPVAFKVERWKCGPHPFNKRAMCGGNASSTIKRTDYGMKFGVPAIGDEIRVMVNFEAYKD